MTDDQNLFRQFVGEMDSMLRDNEKTDTRTQKAMIDDLIALEAKFKRVLLSSESGKEIYKKFMSFILNDKGNILSARVYFRERQETFSDKLFKAFHCKRSKMLHKFRINYLFVKWCMGTYRGPNKKILLQIMIEIETIRSKLCENNLPLAINRAKIFWSNVPPSHLEYMDMIQAASEGLLTALDKFVPPYRTVFRSTAIGRMTLNMMTDYNDTLVKIPPKEKRILYRANNAKRKQNMTEQSKVVDYVNESFRGVTESELSAIEAAASNVIDIYQKTEDTHSLSERLPDEKQDVERNASTDQMRQLIYQGLAILEILERKIVFLKHGDV